VVIVEGISQHHVGMDARGSFPVDDGRVWLSTVVVGMADSRGSDGFVCPFSFVVLVVVSVTKVVVIVLIFVEILQILHRAIQLHLSLGNRLHDGHIPLEPPSQIPPIAQIGPKVHGIGTRHGQSII